MNSQRQSCHQCHQFWNRRKPATLPWWSTSDRPGNESLRASSFFGLLRLLLLSTALHKNTENEKGVSRSNGFLFRLTNFWNDFFIVHTLTKWCRIAAFTVLKKLEVLSDRTLSACVAIFEWSSNRKAPMCWQVPSVQPIFICELR